MEVIHAFIAAGAKFFEVPFIQFVEDELNNRPRKRFKFRSPIHTFDRLTQ